MLETRVRGAERVARMVKQPEKFLSTILLGNNLVNTAAASLATALAVSVWQEQGILYATIGVTAILLVFGEVTPKTVAFQHAERMSISFARPIEVISWLFTPFVAVLSWIASGFAKMFGGTTVSRSLASPEEIRTMITVAHRDGTVEKSEAEMLHRVFEFGDRHVREVMVPRPDVVAIARGSKIADFLALYVESPLSRFPVYQEDMDKVVGTLSVKDVLMGIAKNTINNESPIDELVRQPYFTPETKRIDELLAEMQAKNFHMAVVVDEYGDTAGIATLTNLVEEIVGGVGDEMAAIEKDYEIIDEHTFHIDGSMRIEEANDVMGLQLAEGDYETVAGFILHLLGHIPKIGEQLRYKDLKLTVTEMRGMKIEKILLTREKKEKHAEAKD